MTSNARTPESLGFPVDGVPQINNLFDDPVSRPAYGNAGGHSGIDFGTTNDETPVRAMAGGTVTKVVTDQVGGGVEDNYDRTVPNTYHPDHPLGNQVQITTSDGTVHVYGHLAHDTITLNRDDTVEKDGQLGIAGATGYTRGGHVHVEVRPGGSDVSALHACPVRIRGGDDFLADLPTEGAAAPSTIPTTPTSLVITSWTVAPVYRDANPESPVLSRLQKGDTTYAIKDAAGSRADRKQAYLGLPPVLPILPSRRRWERRGRARGALRGRPVGLPQPGEPPGRALGSMEDALAFTSRLRRRAASAHVPLSQWKV